MRMRRVGSGALVLAIVLAVSGARAQDAGPRVLRIVDQDKAPVADVKVALPDAAPLGEKPMTDADGRVAFGSDVGDVAWFDGLLPRRTALKDGVTEVVAENFPLVEVDVVDATTGAPVEDRPVEFVDSRGGVRKSVSGPKGALRVARDDWGTANVRVRVDAPRGLATVGDECCVQIEVPARRARLAVLLWPETKRTFRLTCGALPVSGATLRGAQVFHDLTASDARFAAEPSDEHGLVTIGGMPRIPFGQAALWFSAPVRDVERRTPDVVVDLDAKAGDTPIDVGLSSVDSDWRPPGMPIWDGRREPVPDPAAPLDVVVKRRDGTPAIHAIVQAGDRSERTGADGHARFDRLPKGATALRAWDVGAFPAAGRATVGADASVTLTEAEGMRATVEVVDAAGNPLRSAIVGVVSLDVPDGDGGRAKTECSVRQFDGDALVLRVLTDAKGRAQLDVPAGRNRFCAQLGRAFAFVETGATSVKVVVTPPQ